MTAQPTPATVLSLFAQAGSFAKTNAETTAAKSVRVVSLMQDGYRRWFDGVTASVSDASRLAADLGKARNAADLAALQRDWLSTTQARVTEGVQGFLDVSTRIAAEITALPIPAVVPAVVPAPAPAAEEAAPKAAAPEAPKAEAPAVKAPAVETPEPVPAKLTETAPVAAIAAAAPVEVPVKELVATVKAEQAAVPAPATAAAPAKAEAKPAPRRAGKPAPKASTTLN